MSTELVTENSDTFSIADVLKDGTFTEFSPLSHFHPSTNAKTALLVLNQNITVPPSLLTTLHAHADVTVCADGAVNRLRTYTAQHNMATPVVPHYVVGDLDSASSENLTFYQASGTVKILQSSQYYTDFNKSVALINSLINFPNIVEALPNLNTVDELETLEDEYNSKLETPTKIEICVLGGVGGRFDQTISTIHQIYKYKLSRSHITFTVLNPEHPELVFMLPPGNNFIKMPKLANSEERDLLGFNTTKSRPNMRNVGILPLLNDAVISTHGLKWDVQNWSTSLKSKVSSSNLQAAEEGFIIKSSDYLFINVEL